MANINITGNVTLLKNTAVDSSGVAIAPTSLEYGQIAINYNAKDPCIFIKVLDDNGATSIQKFVGEAVIAKTLSDILGESAADLATLKDLIKQFEGSNNDVLTLVKNLTTEVSKKASTADFNSHKNNTSNPHSVTASQVGAPRVLNYGSTDLNTITGNNLLTIDGSGNTNTPISSLNMRVLTIGSSANRTTQMAFDWNEDRAFLRKVTDGNWSTWKEFYTNANCNNENTDWTVNQLFLPKDSRGVNFYGGNYVGKESGRSIVIGSDGARVEIKDINDNTYHRVYSSHNANSIDIDWNCKNLTSQGQILLDSDSGIKDYRYNWNGFLIRHRYVSNVDVTQIGTVGGTGKDTSIITASSHGRVGILTDNPIAALDVRGDVNIGDTSQERTLNVRNINGFGNGLLHLCRWGGNLAIGGIENPLDKVHINGSVRLNQGGTFTTTLGSAGAATHNNGFFNLAAVTLGEFMDAKQGVILIGEIVNSGNENKTSITGKLAFERGSKYGFNITGYADVCVSKAYNSIKASIRSEDMHLEVGTCIYKSKTYLAIRTKSDTAACSVYFSGFKTGNATLGITDMSQCSNWVSYETSNYQHSGSVTVGKNLIVKGEAVTYSQDGVEARTVAAASATRLADLEDVDLTGASDNFVLYRSNTTNSNGDRIWKARSDAKSWSEISGKPTTFTPVDHNHIGGTYTTPSDRGLKTNVLPLDNGLNTILSINPVSYNWTSEAMDKYHFTHHNSIGVIAQELEDIIPTAVMQMDDQYKSVDYVQIIPYLVSAVKQLNSELANKNIAIENARKDYKRAYGESVNLKKEVDSLKIELDQIKTLLTQNLI